MMIFKYMLKKNGFIHGNHCCLCEGCTEADILDRYKPRHYYALCKLHLLTDPPIEY